MKVSIAMATFNGAKHLQQQLESFAVQERMPDELVVSDDDSTDETWSILQTFAKAAAFDVRLVRNSVTLGYTQNFGRAMSMCTGDLIFLSDQDDVWFSNKIARVQAAVEADPRSQVFMNDAELAHEDLSLTGVTMLQQIRSARKPDSSFVIGCCIAARAGFLRYALPVPDAYVGHDKWLVHLATGLGRRHLIEEPLQFYRRHAASASQSILNRTKKLGRAAYFWYRLTKSLTSDSSIMLVEDTSRTREALRRVQLLFSDGNVPCDVAEDLEKFASALSLRLDASEARIRVREANRIYRVVPILKMLARRQYSHFAGTTSALRDIFLS